MTSRITSAAIGIPLLVLLIWAGGAWFTSLVGVAAAIGTLEFAGLARRWGGRPLLPLAVLLSVGLIVAGHLLASTFQTGTALFPLVGAGAALSTLWLIWRPQGKSSLSAWAVTVGGVLYVGGLLFYAPPLRALDQGREWVLFLLLVTFATDTGAFFVGRAIGRRPLAPGISPSKTWEGALGGVVAALGVSFALVYILDLDVGNLKTLALGAAIGVAGQFGDLAESRLKRIAGVKDSGWLLPGHGGILDRLDSIVFNLVVVYYLVS